MNFTEWVNFDEHERVAFWNKWTSSLYCNEEMDHYTVKDDIMDDGTCEACGREEAHCTCHDLQGACEQCGRADVACSCNGLEEESPESSESPQLSPKCERLTFGGKRPRKAVQELLDLEADEEEEEGSSSSDEAPDLTKYFSKWEISLADEVAFCRTHANAVQRRLNYAKERSSGKANKASSSSASRAGRAASIRAKGAIAK